MWVVVFGSAELFCESSSDEVVGTVNDNRSDSR
jgi:hypothetical protein